MVRNTKSRGKQTRQAKERIGVERNKSVVLHKIKSVNKPEGLDGNRSQTR
uniref:Uncharacterized protein n=1 Tax=Anguilla anguilla TaxID=7936 RepID=A0A0E9VGD8_ANGAN